MSPERAKGSPDGSIIFSFCSCALSQRPTVWFIPLGCASLQRFEILRRFQGATLGGNGFPGLKPRAWNPFGPFGAQPREVWVNASAAGSAQPGVERSSSPSGLNCRTTAGLING